MKHSTRSTSCGKARSNSLLPQTMAHPEGAIGIDLGDQTSYFCMLDASGQILSEGTLATTPEAFRKFFAPIPSTRIAIENGSHSAWIAHLFNELGHECIVANPRELRKIHQSDRKDDRSDARILARLARFDPELLAPIEHRMPAAQVDLALIRARDSLVRARTQCINTARGLVKPLGKRLPACTAEYFAKKVKSVLPEGLESLLLPLINTVEALSMQIAIYDKEIDSLCQEKYPETELLTPVTGVGKLTALTFILTLGDKARFHASREVGAYLGLVPRRYDSGNRVSQLGITKAGDSLLRKLLVGSAQYLLCKRAPDCDLRRHGERLMERGGKNGKKRAVIAVARKLSVLLHHLWNTGAVYQALHTNRAKHELVMT